MKTAFFAIVMLFVVAMSNNSCSRSDNTQIPNLSKAEMTEDIDFLYRTIKDVCPNLTIKEKVTGTKLYAELDSLWGRVKEIKSFEDFYYLVSQMLILTQDQHNTLQTFYPEEDQGKNLHLYSEAIKISEACASLYDEYFPAYSSDITYINGAYFFKEDIFDMETKEAVIPFSAKLIAVNGIPIDDYINVWNRKVDNSIRWDFENQKYFTHRLYPPFCTGLSDDEYTITYQLKGSTQVVDRNRSLGMEGRLNSEDSAQVLCFPNEAMLYIRIPEMDFQQIAYFQNEIQKYAGKDIEKVVIDIRNNGGGNDLVWMNVLSALIDETIIVQERMCFRNSPVVVDYLKKKRGMEVDKPVMNITSIEGVEFIDYSFCDTIAPSNASIHYKGTIYVLVNNRCFSSSLAFSSFCNRTNRLITVGQPTGYIGGRGITPFFFTLPHSKLIVEISPTLDATNAKTPVDYYDYYVKIAVPLTINDYYVKIAVPLTINDYGFELKYKGSRYGREFLFNHDPVFKAILDIKK